MTSRSAIKAPADFIACRIASRSCGVAPSEFKALTTSDSFVPAGIEVSELLPQLAGVVDDLDGESADETVEFGIDGKSYEIDLSKENAGRLRDVLADFVSAARRAGGRRRAGSSAGSGSGGGAGAAPKGRASIDREQNQAIRDWARKRGMKVVVVGAAGQLGRVTVERWAGAHEVTALTRREVDLAEAAVEAELRARFSPALRATAASRNPRAEAVAGARADRRRRRGRRCQAARPRNRSRHRAPRRSSPPGARRRE